MKIHLKVELSRKKSDVSTRRAKREVLSEIKTGTPETPEQIYETVCLKRLKIMILFINSVFFID